MQTYRLVAPHFVVAAIVSGDYVVQSAPILAWAVGKPFAVLRDYAQRKGWTVEPLVENAHPMWVELHNRLYEITWDGENIKGILMHEAGEEPREVTYGELPEELRDEL